VKRFLVEIPDDTFAKVRNSVTWHGRHPQPDTDVCKRCIHDGIVYTLGGSSALGNLVTTDGLVVHEMEAGA